MDTNPYKSIRLEHSLSQQEFSQAYKISVNTLSNSESGLYLQPPKAHTEALLTLEPSYSIGPPPDPSLTDPPSGAVEGWTPVTLTNAWLDWQLNERMSQAPALKVAIEDALTKNPHSFKEFRHLISSTLYGFAKFLVFDIRTLQFYEQSGAQPGKLWEALSQVLQDDELLAKVQRL